MKPKAIIKAALKYLEVFEKEHRRLEDAVAGDDANGTSLSQELWMRSHLVNIEHFAATQCKMSRKKLEETCKDDEDAVECLQRIKDCTVRQILSGGYSGKVPAGVVTLLASSLGDYKQKIETSGGEKASVNVFSPVVQLHVKEFEEKLMQVLYEDAGQAKTLPQAMEAIGRGRE